MSSDQTKHSYYRLSVFRITKTPLLQSPKMLTKVVDFLGGGAQVRFRHNANLTTTINSAQSTLPNCDD